MKSIRLLACATASAAAFLVFSGTALAHHSAAQFDFGNTVRVSGVVKYVRFANPHAKIILEVTDDARGTRDIEFEGHSRNNMVREGLVPDMFTVGDKITISIAPMRDGSDGGYITAFITEDGKAVGRITAAD
jgi:cytochrome c-type biogenesis protein CcmE